MSKNAIRKDKTCLNCNYVVENKFCPNCGQENVDTRKTFHHLFIHFFEDLTHYENSFWKTIRNLIFRPASLTKEYLSGKRMSYLAPIRLYIFISFITFFLINVIPNSDKKTEDSQGEKNVKTIVKKIENDTIFKEQKKIIDLEKEGILSKAESDSLQKMIVDAKNKNTNNNNKFFVIGESYKSTEQLDSIQKYGKPDDQLGTMEYWIVRKIQVVQDKHSNTNTLQEKFMESFSHNLPKSLFIYMPIFAFVLWVFQSKKRWYYFDHGIFTLHYFSFLLLGLLIVRVFNFLFRFVNDYYIFNILENIFMSVAAIYMLYYFFPAHRRFYGETRISSIIKGIAIFFINIISIVFILLVMAIYSFITIH